MRDNITQPLWRWKEVLSIALVLLRGAFVSPVDAAECLATGPYSALQVTADCTDPLFNVAVIDSETDEVSPVVHRKVTGHWNNTSVGFNIYLPPKSLWAGRFFQFVYPTQNSSALPEAIAFGAFSGAYTVQIDGQQGYRADAATAKFAKEVAQSYYNKPSNRIYGYIYGGSGGSLQTVGAMENTFGVWDGGIPFVQAVPVSIPNNLAGRGLASFVLQSKAAQIEAALRPGGSGNPFKGLDNVEKAVLLEATKFGVPIEAWEYFTEPGDTSTLSILAPTVREMDPTYADDFWTKIGYLGTEKSKLGALFRAALVDKFATIERIEYNSSGVPLTLGLDTAFQAEASASFDFTAYDSTGKTAIGPLVGSIVNNTLTISPTSNGTIISSLSQGGKLRVDNRWFLSLHSYHRHQIPSIPGFYGFDQYLDASGQPKWPQRATNVGPLISASTAGGGTHSGNITAKMIVVDNLVDSNAFPWHADWYRSQVRQALGHRFENNYRIWYNERADHFAEPLTLEKTLRLVPYNGIYYQALRDLSAWVENGTAPPASTRYSVKDSQIILPNTASERLGVQPVVALRINRPTSVPYATVTFTISANVPPGAGKISLMEWDFLGTGDYVPIDFGKPSQSINSKVKYKYGTAGSYIPAVRVTAQRDDVINTPFARVQNLARAAILIS